MANPMAKTLSDQQISKHIEMTLGVKGQGEMRRVFKDITDDLRNYERTGSRSIQEVQKRLQRLIEAARTNEAVFVRAAKESSSSMEKLGKSVAAVTGMVKGLVGTVATMADAMPIGIASAVTHYVKFNKQLLTTTTQFAKYGQGITNVEKSLNKISKATGLTRTESMKLLSVYERGFPYNSLERGEKLFLNIKQAVGGNEEAMSEMLGTLDSIVEKFPEMEDGITNLNDTNRKLLESQGKMAYFTGQLSLKELRRFQDYVRGGRQANTEDEKRRKLMQEQIDAINEIRRVFEKVSLELGKALMPILKKIGEWLEQHGDSLEKWIPKLIKIGLVLKGIQITLGTMKALNLLDSGPGGAAGMGAKLGRAAGGAIVAGGAGYLAGSLYHESGAGQYVANSSAAKHMASATGMSRQNVGLAGELAAGGAAGAAVGSIVPGVGTVAGAAVGTVGAGIGAYGRAQDALQAANEELAKSEKELAAVRQESVPLQKKLMTDFYGTMKKLESMGVKDQGARAEAADIFNRPSGDSLTEYAKHGISATEAESRSELWQKHASGSASPQEEKLLEKILEVNVRMATKQGPSPESQAKAQEMQKKSQEAEKEKKSAKSYNEVVAEATAEAFKASKAWISGDIDTAVSSGSKMDKLFQSVSAENKYSETQVSPQAQQVMKEKGVDTGRLITEKSFKTDDEIWQQMFAARKSAEEEMVELEKRASRTSDENEKKKMQTRIQTLQQTSDAISGITSDLNQKSAERDRIEQHNLAAYNEFIKSLEAAKGLMGEQSELLSAMVQTAETSGGFGMQELNAQLKQVLDSTAFYMQMERKNLQQKRQSIEDTIKQNKETMDANTKEIERLRATGSEKDKQKANEKQQENEMMELREKAGKRQLAGMTSEAQSAKEIAQWRKIIVDRTLTLGNINRKNVEYAGSEVSKAEALINIYENMGAGLSASAEMRMQAAEMVGKQIAAVDVNIKNLQSSLAEGEEGMYQKLLEDEKEKSASAAKKGETYTAKSEDQLRKEAADGLLAVETDINGKQVERLGLINKQAQMTKAIRDGYVSAITAMTAGSGMFNKILIAQDKNMGFGIKHLGVLQSKTSGGVGEGKTQAGQFTPEGLFGGSTEQGYRTYSGQMSNNNDIRAIQQNALGFTQEQTARVRSGASQTMGAPHMQGTVLQSGVGPASPGQPAIPKTSSPAAGTGGGVPVSVNFGGIQINYNELSQMASRIKSEIDSGVNKALNEWLGSGSLPTST